MRFLIIDDETISRLTLERMLGNYGTCQSAGTGKAALTAFADALRKNEPFDVITIDLQLPDINGLQLMLKMQELERRIEDESFKPAIKLIISAHSKKELIISCVQRGCDGYIIKPFNRDTILGKIRKCGLNPEYSASAKGMVDLNAMADELYVNFERGHFNLPSHPAICQKFRELRVKEASYKELEEVLKNDISISAKLIQVANSAMFGGIVKSSSVAEAIGRLGIMETEKYVNAIANKKLYERLPNHLTAVTQELWQHSMAVAYSAELINRQLKAPLELDMFTMGLMHDIGKLLLLEMFSELAGQKKQHDILKQKAFFELVDQMHEKFGAELMVKWKFPPAFAQMILYHEKPDQAPSLTREIAIIHLANLMAMRMGYTMGKKEVPEMDQDLSFRLLKVRNSQLDEVEQKVKRQMETAATLL